MNPTNPLESLLQQSSRINLFAEESRYAQCQQVTYLREDGKQIPYIERRFLPKAGQLAPMTSHRTVQDDRLDLAASEHLGNPLLFWRIADANNAMNPLDLTAEPDQLLSIALPEGVPAPARA